MPDSRKKKTGKTLRISVATDEAGWVARGARVKVEAETMRACKQRAKAKATQEYGAEIDIRWVLVISEALAADVKENRRQRKEVRAARASLRRHTVDLIERLQDEMPGATFDDAAELLGIDSSVLSRQVKSTTTDIPD